MFVSAYYPDTAAFLISCQEEDVTLAPEALSVLTTMALETTLRYALNLISTANVVARRRKSPTVGMEDLKRCYTYFLDEKRSVQWLKEQQGSLVFDELEKEGDSNSRMDVS